MGREKEGSLDPRTIAGRIRVTRAMVEAGAFVLDELSDYSHDFVAEKVFDAMLAMWRREYREGDPPGANE